MSIIIHCMCLALALWSLSTRAHAQSGTVVADGLAYPYAAALDSAERYLYVSCQGVSIVRCDLLTGEKEVMTTDFGSYGICFSKDWSMLYIGTGDNTNSDLTTLTIPGLLQDSLVTGGLAAPSGFCLDATGDFMYITDRSNSRIMKINTTTGEKTLFYGSLSRPFAMDIDQSAQNLYVSNTMAGTMLKMNIASGLAVDTVAGVGSPLSINLDPADEYAYIADGATGAINKVELAGMTVTGFRAAGELPAIGQSYNGCMDRAGNNIYYPNFYAGTIVKVALAASSTGHSRGGAAAAAFSLIRTDHSGRSVTVYYTAPVSEEVALGVYGMNGMQVTELAGRHTGGDRYAASWDTRGVAAGMYFCRLSTGGTAITGKIVVVR